VKVAFALTTAVAYAWQDKGQQVTLKDEALVLRVGAHLGQVEIDGHLSTSFHFSEVKRHLFVAR
jgi:hypothetical protein